MSMWAKLLTDLERTDFELQRATDPAALTRLAHHRSRLLARIESLDPDTAQDSERVRLSAALVRGRDLLERWRRDRERMRAEAGNLHASRQLLQALQPSRSGAHFRLDS